MMKYDWERNELRIADAGGTMRKLSFDWPIGAVIEYDRTLFVLLSSPVKSGVNENVLGVSSNGNVMWTIEKTTHLYDDSPYTGMEITADGLVAHNWDGKSVVVNAKDGTVSKALQSK